MIANVQEEVACTIGGPEFVFVAGTANVDADEDDEEYEGN